MRRPLRPSSRQNRTDNPLFPENVASPQNSGPLTAGVGRLERGTIIECDAGRYMYRVALNSGRTLPMSRIKSHPGDNLLLPIRTTVVVTWALGLPYILGVLPEGVSEDDTAIPTPVTDVPGYGGDDPAMARNLGATARAPDDPQDLLPGDYVMRSPDGAAVGALNGKVAMLRGGPFAKILALGEHDVVKIFAGVLQMVTWMGESKTVNENGKTSFIWRGGTDQLTQTGSDEGRYTIKFDLGHTGDILLLEITNRDGQTMFRFHVSPSGACEIFAAGGWNQHGGGAATDIHPVRFYGRQETEVAGDSTERVSGSVSVTHAASRTEQIHDDHTVGIGGNARCDIGGGSTRGIGGDDNITISGAHHATCSGNYTTDVQGSSAYAVNTVSGNQVFTPQSGHFQVKTNNADAIVLGDNPSSHATKYEELAQQLSSYKQQLDVFFALVASHVHGSLATPSPSLSPYISQSPASLSLDSAKSTAVKLT